jgi:hypothetical protein
VNSGSVVNEVDKLPVTVIVVVVVFGKITHTVTGSSGGRVEQVLTFWKSVYVAEYDVEVREMFPRPGVTVATEVYIVKFPGVAIIIEVGVEDLFPETRLVVDDQVVFVNLLVLEFEETEAVLGHALALEFEGAAVDTRNDSEAKEDEMIFDVCGTGSVSIRPVHGRVETLSVGIPSDTPIGEGLKLVATVTVSPMLST